MYFLDANSVYWSSKKKSVISMSSNEAEYLALDYGAIKVI